MYMQAAVRSYQAMGVALIGAGVIAVSPLAPPMPHVQAVQRAVSSAGVELDALVNPIEAWVQVLQAAGANLGTIAQTIIDNPTPILSQVIANQTGYWQAFNAAVEPQIQQIQNILKDSPIDFQKAWVQVQAGNLVTNGTDSQGNLISTGALNLLNDQIVSPILVAATLIGTDALLPLANMAQNVTNALNTLQAENPPYDAAFLTAVIPSVLPVASAINALAQTTQDVVNGVGAGNVAAAVNALVNAPATLVGALLNGYGEVAGSPGAGILTPWTDLYGEFGSGPIGSLNYLRELIAEAIGATAPASAAALAVTPAAAVSAIASVPTASKIAKLPATSANLVTLDAASPAKDVGALALKKIAAIAAPAAAAKTVTVDLASSAKDVSAVAPTATSAAATSDASAVTIATKPSRLNPTKDVSAGTGKALKNAAAGTGAKSSSTSTGGSKSSAGGSNGGGRHRANK
jgi:hypothetical protein